MRGARAGAPGEAAAASPEAGWALLRREAPRKLIHVAAAAAALVLAWTLPPMTVRGLFLAVALLAVGLDLARLRLPAFGRRLQHALGPILRPGEAGRFTGATTLAIGLAAAVLVTPRAVAVAAIGYAGFADAAGALVGRAFGRHRYRSGRSLEGTAAFAAVAFLVGWASPALGPGGAAAVAIALALVEAAPLPLDDNLLVPVLGAALAWAASALP